METGRWWRNSFGGGDGSGTDGDDVSGGGVRVGHNNNNNNNTNNIAWGDIWDVSTLTPPAAAAAAGGTTRYDWRHPTGITTACRVPEESVIHALLLGHDVTTTNNNSTNFHHARSVGSTSNSVVHHHRMPLPDPHMICLKLGKRQYFEDAVVPESSSVTTKRNKQPYGQLVVDAATAVWPGVGPLPSTAAAGVPRCQVEGCHVALGNSKEYYRRHKVCEIHSKSPKVVVLGLQQRFCQQCSRFHGVTEFDEAKRSCRRRLEGHNQRRRKGSLSNSLIPRSFPHPHEYNCMMERPLRPSPPSPPQPKAGCALSLLSSPKTEPWISSDDLSTRCSAALYELIAANRATSVVAHRLNQDDFYQSGVKNAMETLPETQMWDGFDHTAMTLDLKQAPSLNFGLFSVKEKSKNPEEWTDYCWSAFGGSNIV